MPQRKLTDAPEFSELPELTAQQLDFVRHILAGKTASDAYRLAYNAENMANKSIWVEASRLRNSPDVALWLGAARKANLGSAVLTKEQHMQELERLREIALDTGNVGAAVQAEMSRGKVAGHHVERVADVTDTDPISTLKEIAQHSPDLAAQLAQQYGVEWTKPANETAH